MRAGHDSDRTLRQHKSLVRARLGITADPGRAREVAGQAIRAAAQAKDNPVGLINVALEELVRARLELPGYSTLDELAASIRAQVNTAVFAGIAARMTPADARVIDGLLEVGPVRRAQRLRPAQDGSAGGVGSAVQRPPQAPGLAGLPRRR